MDGLAAGIAAIACFALAVGVGDTNSVELLLLSVFIGALVGFLIYNFNPASIFMGDCGSLFVGFLLAGSVMLNQTGGRSRSVFTILAVPVLTLFVPIFDTTFVTVLRKIWGRKASQGGRDHTSHRLVALGLTEKSAVLLLYGLALSAGVLSIIVRQLGMFQSIALVSLFTIILTIIGVYLAKVKVYEEQQEEIALQNKAAFGFLLNLSHKRRVFEVFLDAGLISLAYYGSYVILWGDFENTPKLGFVYQESADFDRSETGGISGRRSLSRNLALYEHRRFDDFCKRHSARFGVEHFGYFTFLSFYRFFAHIVFR